MMPWYCVILAASDLLLDQPLDLAIVSEWEKAELPDVTLRDARADDVASVVRIAMDSSWGLSHDDVNARGFVRLKLRASSWRVGMVMGRNGSTRMTWDQSRGAVLVYQETPPWALMKAYVAGQRGMLQWMIGSITARTRDGLVFASPRRYGDGDVLGVDDQTRMQPRTSDLYQRASLWGGGLAWRSALGVQGAVFAGFMPMSLSQYAWQGGRDRWTLPCEDACNTPVFLDASNPERTTQWMSSQRGWGEWIAGSEWGWKSTQHAFHMAGYGGKRVLSHAAHLEPTLTSGVVSRDTWGVVGGSWQSTWLGWHGRGSIALTDTMSQAALLEARYETPVWEWGTQWRYYSRDYDNPHTVAPASPSSMLGFRTRNEWGARMWWESRTHTRHRAVLDVTWPAVQVRRDPEPYRVRLDARSGRWRDGNGAGLEAYTTLQWYAGDVAWQHSMAARFDMRHGPLQFSMRGYAQRQQVINADATYPYGAILGVAWRITSWLACQMLTDVRRDASSWRIRSLLTWTMKSERVGAWSAQTNLEYSENASTMAWFFVLNSTNNFL